jgi:putative NIF3 family GTP cyclohydrolase 1 type 2
MKGVGLLAMHLPAEQAKPGAQSALLAQLVLHVVPEAGQMRLLAQVRGAGNLHVPALHIPGSTTLGDEQLELPQLAVGNVQAPLLRHTPLQTTKVFDATWQSLLLQQFAAGMQAALPHCFEPVLHTYEHRRLLQVAVVLAIVGQSARRLQWAPVVKTADSTT